METAHFTIKHNNSNLDHFVPRLTLCRHFFSYFILFLTFFRSKFIAMQSINWMLLCSATSTSTHNEEFLFVAWTMLIKFTSNHFWHIMFLFFTSPSESEREGGRGRVCEFMQHGLAHNRHDFYSFWLILVCNEMVVRAFQIYFIYNPSYYRIPLCRFITLVIMVKYDSLTFSFWFYCSSAVYTFYSSYAHLTRNLVLFIEYFCNRFDYETCIQIFPSFDIFIASNNNTKITILTPVNMNNKSLLENTVPRVYIEISLK